MSDSGSPNLFDKAANLLKELSSPSSVFKGCIRGSVDLVPDVAPAEFKDRLGNLAVNAPGRWTSKQLASVLSLAIAAPVGKSTDTVIDPGIRKAKEITADRLVIRNEAAWKSCLVGQILPQVARGLWPDRPNARVLAQLYKMTLYEPGGFFKPHRDTLRDDHHVGTLVVVLPSNGACCGGDLVVQDANGDEVRVESPTRHSEAPWIAFFASSLHEVQPVTHGIRLALLYHLHLVPSPQGAAPRAPKKILPPLAACLKDIATSVASTSGECSEEEEDELFAQSNRPSFVGFLLAHAYGGALVADKLQGLDKLLYETVAPHFKGARLASVDIRVHGPGGGDDERCTRTAAHMNGIIAEIDEVSVQKAPKRKGGGGGFFSKAIYPARPLSTLCIRSFDCATDIMDGDVVSSVHWLAPPALPTDEYGRGEWGVGQSVEGGVLKQILKLKHLERSVRGTGNEGSEAYFLYRHAALLVPLKKNADRDLGAFSQEHAQRGHPDYNP